MPGKKRALDQPTEPTRKTLLRKIQMSHEAIATNLDQQIARPKVAILLSPARRDQVFSPPAEEQLASFATPVIPEGTQLHSEDLPALLDGAIACLTGWGTPTLNAG